MSKVFEFKWELPPLKIIADSLQEAEALLSERVDDYAGSNDGSELLANANMKFVQEYVCNHPNMETKMLWAYRGVHSYSVTHTSEAKADVKKVVTRCPDCVLYKETEWLPK